MSPEAQLRRRIRGLRGALPESEQRKRAHSLARVLGRSTVFQRSERIASYLSVDGEIDPAPLMSRAATQGKHNYLPALREESPNRLWFVEHRPGDPLLPNRFGIPEPLISHRERTRVWSLDLILLPLVAFDRHGNRLGMGGGYYDRTLACFQGPGHWRRPWLVGVSHGFQLVDRLPSRPWDVPLDAVATEEKLWVWRGGANKLASHAI